jgi:hypothetical protein
MSAVQVALVEQEEVHQEFSFILEVTEIESLIRSIDDSLIKIQAMQLELKDLEKSLNQFLDLNYGSEASILEINADELNILDPEQAKNNVFNKIAKICSHDSFSIAADHVHEGLLKIEGYLIDGSDQSQAPQDILNALAKEYQVLTQQIQDLQKKEANSLDNSAYELKQEVMWANIKTTEAITKIKNDIYHQANKMH